MSNLHVIHEISLQDIPGHLRRLADAIEHGEHGTAVGCALVLDAQVLSVFYWGSGEAGANAHLLLHAGAAKMMRAVMEEKA